METLLKEPNIRRDGWSRAVLATDSRFQCLSTKNVVIKTQHQYYCRPVWNGFRKTPVVRRELRALNALMLAGIDVPLVVAYEESTESASLTTTFIEDGRPLDVALTVAGADRDSIVTSAARTIGRLHGAGWTHGALYPDHLLVVVSSAATTTYLIDLEKARRGRRFQRDLRRFDRYRSMFTEQEQGIFDAEYRKALGR